MPHNSKMQFPQLLAAFGLFAAAAQALPNPSAAIDDLEGLVDYLAARFDGDLTKRAEFENVGKRDCNSVSRCGIYCAAGAMGPDARTVRAACGACRAKQASQGEAAATTWHSVALLPSFLPAKNSTPRCGKRPADAINSTYGLDAIFPPGSKTSTSFRAVEMRANDTKKDTPHVKASRMLDCKSLAKYPCWWNGNGE
ncbi:hypothetical protein MKZ38_002393 [Zalerion maritima]|uniref:Uncharacterized protein n=1 Tax=Zalerion maritima TaxID=339359 RepID=A0AAD5RVS7_9PEZI|nr:hypothetical protein MKZ38_002393 [Zalerion maritima]